VPDLEEGFDQIVFRDDSLPLFWISQTDIALRFFIVSAYVAFSNLFLSSEKKDDEVRCIGCEKVTAGNLIIADIHKN